MTASTTSPTGRRLLGADALTASLPEAIPPGEEVLEGAPMAHYLELPTAGETGVEVGLWEMTPGAARDTEAEAEEIFVVLSGRATLAFDERGVLELAAGSVVRLHVGDRTTWTIHEPLRKLYVQLA